MKYVGLPRKMDGRKFVHRIVWIGELLSCAIKFAKLQYLLNITGRYLLKTKIASNNPVRLYA